MTDGTVSVNAPSPRPFLRSVPLVVLAGSAVLLVFMRLHAFDVPLETDECNYAYIAARLLEGERLYVDVWDHQPPGVFMLFAGAIALFGDSPQTFRWLATGFSLLSLALVFAIARCVCGAGGASAGPFDEPEQHRGQRPAGRAAILAAVLFALVSSDPGTAGDGVNREIYMNTLVLGAWYVVLRAVTSRGRGGSPAAGLPVGAVFISGALLGIGSLIKTVLAVHWLALAVWIGIVAWRRGGGGARAGRAATRVLAFGAGPVVIWLVTAAYFFADGRFDEFVDAVFLFNVSYGAGESLPARLVQFWRPPRHPFIFDSALPLWIAGLAALPWVVYVVSRGRKWVANGSSHGVPLLLALIVASFAAVCVSGRFWPHYYLLLVPGCVLLASAFMASLSMRVAGPRACKSSDRSGTSLIQRIGGAAICAALPLLVAGTEYRHYLSQPPFGITNKRYQSRDFWGKAHGENVRRVTDPDDEVFVFGKDAGIYYYGQRRCASRFTMITGIQQAFSGAARRRELLMQDLREAMPRLILVLADEGPFPEFLAFLHEHYSEPIGWDLGDLTREAIMFVVARKDRPVEPIDWDWDRSEVSGWPTQQAR